LISSRKYLTDAGPLDIIRHMQKMFLGFLVIVTLGVAGCGVKSDLVRPDGYPRNYPVY